MMSTNWIKYDFRSIADELVNAKAEIIALSEIPYYREWTLKLQEVELRREIEGTTRIEGAVFTERELDQAISESPDELLTRSQRQGAAMKIAYDWIAGIPSDEPVTADLILSLHSKIITNADDDHCLPGEVRESGENVTFGMPRRRGAEGGTDCKTKFVSFANSIQSDDYQSHDLLIQALAVHYHLGSIHPFSDGNGRTARALEALMLKKAGLHNTCFVAMSNYYYEERFEYMKTLSEVHQNDDDLTPFLRFGLKGIALQVRRIMNEIKPNLQKALYKNLMYDLFGRLKSPKKRVIAKRQIAILELLLKVNELDVLDLLFELGDNYEELKAVFKAYNRDLSGLLHLGAITIIDTEDEFEDIDDVMVKINLDWPTEITGTSFIEKLKQLPKARTKLSIK